MELLELYDYLLDHNTEIDWFSMEAATSLSIPLSDGACAIALDPCRLHTLEEELVCLAHEGGHCMTGSFYNRYAACDVRQRHENRADKWAIKMLIPKDTLDEAVCAGIITPWDLAERFCVTEEFMRKAIHYYQDGNLAV